jgi:hypothetical protein
LESVLKPLLPLYTGINDEEQIPEHSILLDKKSTKKVPKIFKKAP